jgi:hypothetical protein
MDGRHQTDQGGGVCQRGNKEGQNAAEGCKTNCYPEKTTIYQVDRDVITQMLAGELFNFREREHFLILPFGSGLHLTAMQVHILLTKTAQAIK